MKENEIGDVVNKICVSPIIKNKVINMVNTENLSNEIIKNRFPYKKVVCIASIVLIFCILFIPNLINTNENFTGQFIITAYAENGEEMILTENVEVLLPEYSVWMNSSIGYPIRINFKNENGDIANGTDEIQLIAEGARIYGENGKLDYQNNKFICHDGETIYWMPILDSEEKFNSDYTMKILAIKNGKVIGQTEVVFISNKDSKRFAWSAKIRDIQ